MKIKNTVSYSSSEEKSYWLSRLFLAVLVLKVLASFIFASSYLKHLFIPFVNWYVLNGFQNPWEHFYSKNLIEIFHYPSVMLWMLAVPRILFSPFLGTDWLAASSLHLFSARLPLLLFDLLLFDFLRRLCPGQQKKLILIYWCSPIVFFINYMYGQLDIIPTALFFISVFLMLQERYAVSGLMLALAAAAKTHVWIVLPFVFIFLYKRRPAWKSSGLFFSIFFGGLILLFLPYIHSPAFWRMVLYSFEQRHLFDFAVQITSEVKFAVCPLVLTVLFIRFMAYPKLNREIFLMFLGIVFMALVLFAPPMPGWFMWSIPFLAYFYVHNKNFSRAPFVIYNVVYFIYFLSFYESRGNWVESLESVFPLRNIAFSVLLASAAFIGFWMLQLGIRKNEEIKAMESPLLIGIGGDSASGKHTLLRVLRSLLGKSRSLAIQGDDFHNWERGNQNWDVYTHLNPSANRLHENADAAVALREGREIEIVHYNHRTGKFTQSERVQPNKFIFFVGLHPFFLKRMRQMIPIKIYLDTDPELKKFWKMNRDVALRGYRPEKVAEQISSRDEDRRKFIEPQKEFADLIITYSADLSSASGKQPKISVSFALDNSVDMKNLHVMLGGVPGLEVSHSVNVYKQTLSVRGSISAREVMSIANRLNMDFEELRVNPRGWVKDGKGITQLVFLLLYHHHMKA